MHCHLGRRLLAAAWLTAGWVFVATAALDAAEATSRPSAERRGPAVRVAYVVTSDRELAGHARTLGARATASRWRATSSGSIAS